MKYILKLIFTYFMLFIITLGISQSSICHYDSTLCKTTKKFNSDFKLELEKKKSSLEKVSLLQTPIVIDIDGDCIPEIITVNNNDIDLNWFAIKNIIIFDSRTLESKISISTDYFVYQLNNFVVNDIDKDGKFEIIVPVADIAINPSIRRGRLVCYNLDGTIKWVSDQKFGKNVGFTNSGSLSIADFNKDGLSEVYIFNEIFNAVTGVKLADGGANGCGLSVISASIAADMDENRNDLELVAGYSVYKVKIVNLNGEGGNLMTAINFKLDNSLRDGTSIILDINLDGKLDVIVCTSEIGFSGVYAYTIVDTIPMLISQISLSDKFLSLGMLSAGNIFATGLGILLTSEDSLRCFKYDKTLYLKEVWKIYRKDNSKRVGCSLFDFDGDGIVEIVTRDEEELKILSAINDVPTVLNNIKCTSGTLFEYPSITDLEGTNNTKICIACGEGDDARTGRLTVFGAPDGQRWAPARGIWNQYAYNPLFINDDGTVPQYMHNPATYKNGKYNNFMVQGSHIDEDGNYPVPAASLTGSIDCIDYDAATDAYLVTFSMSNRADASLTSPVAVPISLYDGDPSLAGRLLTTYRTTATVSAGGTLSGLTASIPASATSGRIFLVVNTDRIAPLAIDSSGYQIDECDYTDNVYQALLPTLTSTTASICTGEIYTYYGRALTTSGTYIHEVTDSKGCDSMIVRLELVVSDTKTQSLTQRECEVYVWRDTTILSSGTYVQRDLSVSGCDSITTLDLTIYPKYNAARIASSCDSFSYAGVRYTRDAIILDDRQSIYGCDSTTTIDLRIHPSITQDITRAACVNYMWNGTTYTDSGNYTYRGQTSMGCDSIVNLALTISNVLTSTQAISGCDRYSWNGTTYTESGSYTFAGTSVSGCDSIATLNLSIGKSQSLTERATACDSYRWNGQLYTDSGDYTYTTTNISGCDSTTLLSLVISRSTTEDIVQSSCDRYTWNGTTYTTSGNYSYLGQSITGCDSMLNLALTILAPDQIQATATACGNYPWNGTTYDRSGSYTYQTLNGVGCDSTVTLDLTIHPVAQSSMSLTACDSIVLHGRTLSASGDYTFELATQYGCDSIVTVSFTTQSDRQSTKLTACDTYTWAATGDTYTQSGRYSASSTNAAGCDSTQVLNLQIAPSYLTTQNANACERYTWPSNQITYTQSGGYTLALKTQAGCDSIQTLALRIDPVFEYRDTVTSATTYTWPINAQDYEQTGVYSEVYQSISVCDSVYWLHLTIKSDIDIYTPNILSTNGTNNYFTLFSNNPSIAVETMNIYDRWGNLIYSKQNFPLNDPTSGWDGKMGGKDVVPGVYVWVALLRLPDGTQVTKQGDVTVL